MLTLEASPFPGKNYAQRLWNQLRANYLPLPIDTPPHLKRLVKRMLTVNPDHRPSLHEILESLKFEERKENL